MAMDLAVICIGNCYVAEDALGCRVYRCLTTDPLAAEAERAGVEVVDGGLCGLDLLREIEGKRRVVFVDAVVGRGVAGETIVLDGATVASFAGPYGHAAGLPYLLNVMPKVCDAPPSQVTLIGSAGALDEAAVLALARRSLEMALHGTP